MAKSTSRPLRPLRSSRASRSPKKPAMRGAKRIGATRGSIPASIRAKGGANAAAKSRAKPNGKVAAKKAQPVVMRAKPPSAAPQAATKGSQPIAKKTPARAKWVYAFGDGKAEGRADMRDLLGGKGA